ncbi:hypothetical protein TcCL_NonESM01418 [Trypanosoma cruzi]|nr:hypothetical protein TcCL_NonESM01418 [Trypanosoma cruzi]
MTDLTLFYFTFRHVSCGLPQRGQPCSVAFQHSSCLFVFWHSCVVVCVLRCFAFFFVFVGTRTAYMLQCRWILVLCLVLAVACGCRSPVVLLREEARDGVGEEGRYRPLLTVTVFAAGDLKRGGVTGVRTEMYENRTASLFRLVIL